MSDGDTELTYVGHATVLIELCGKRILTDPLLGPGILHVRRRVPAPALGDLLPLDAILISHAHLDHLDHGSLRRLAGVCPVIVPDGCAALARRTGALDVIEIDEGDRLAVGGGVVVEGVHASHDGRRHPFARASASLGYLIEGPPNVYFAGDTDLFAGMSALADRVDVALVPIWGWGPSVPAGHLDPGRAAEAVGGSDPGSRFRSTGGRCRAWGAQRRLDPLAPAEAFADAVRRTAPSTEVRILMPGQRTTL